MDYLTLIWTTIQLLLIFATAAGAICLIIGLFHPITVNLKLRASQLGQRGEVWGSYLFGLVKIGVIATPHNQDVALKILSWQKFLQRNRRQKPTRPQPPPPDSDTTFASPASATGQKPADKSETTPQRAPEVAAASIKPAEPSQPTAGEKIEKKHTETSKTESAADAEINTIAAPEKGAEKSAEKDTEKMPVPETFIEPEIKTETARKTETETDVKADATTATGSPDITTAKKETRVEAGSESGIKADSDFKQDSDSNAAVPVQAQPVDGTPVDVTPLKPFAEVAREQKTTEKPEPAGGVGKDDRAATPADGGDDWRARARRFRRDLNNRYRQLKRYIRLFMRKWQVARPILQRFWSRGKKGFSLVEPTLKVRYALHEPYITGMFHGSISIFSGLASQFGLNFIPVPMFGEPCIYARGHVTTVIRPWRFLAAMLGLLLERDLYREAWQLFKWYRARRQQA